MATLRQIARQAGVSPSVVSRALNPKPDKNARVAPATRERILAIAEDLGYQPNRAAEFLRRGSAAAIHAFLPRSPNRLHAETVIGLAEAAGAQGFPLNLCYGRSLQSYRAFVQDSPDLPHSGIITYPYANAGPGIIRVMETFRQKGGKLVVIQSQQEIPDVPTLSIDEAAGGRLVAEHLLSRNCERFFTFGYYTGRIEAFAQAVESAGGAVKPLPGDAKGMQALRRAAARGHRLGVFAAADHYALDIYRAFADQSARIGRELLVVGYDDLFLMDRVTPALTTVYQPMHKLGSRAIHKIVNMIYGKTESSETIRPRLMIRESA